MTIAHFAVKYENPEIIKFLLSKKVFDGNHGDSFDRTALHYAAASSSPETLELILRHQQELIDGGSPVYNRKKAVKVKSITTEISESLQEAQIFEGILF